ncbi:tetratricopeptide repeat protein [Pseudomonas sp. LT1P18]|uniref:tetratricopeptide repeat protein n=1 Tax=Pseudomonas arabinosi TaxID=3398357 RepID=UPI0039F04BE3
MASFFCGPLVLALSMLCCAAPVFADELEDCQRLYNGGHRDQALAPCLRAEKSTRSASIQFALGHIYERGYGVPVDQQKAFTWYMRAARQGHATAQEAVGFAYQQGQGTAIDHVQARTWYLKAGAQDSEGAQFALGELYGKGLGVAADPHQAEQWFLKAANHHNPEMMRSVADHFLRGEMIERDPEKAAIWFKNAAVAGDAPAQLNFAMLLNRGLGVPVDKQAALGWFERAAQHYIGRKGLDPKTCTAECYPAMRYFMLALKEAPASKGNRTKIARLDSLLSGEGP